MTLAARVAQSRQPPRHETFPSHSFHVSEPTCSSRLNIMENEPLFQIGPCLVDSASATDFPAGLVMVTGLVPNPLAGDIVTAFQPSVVSNVAVGAEGLPEHTT